MFADIKFTYQIYPQYIICCLAIGKFVYEFKSILQISFHVAEIPFYALSKWITCSKVKTVPL